MAAEKVAVRETELLLLRQPKSFGLLELHQEGAMTNEFFLDPILALNIMLNRGREVSNAENFWRLLQRGHVQVYLTNDEQDWIYEQIARLSGPLSADTAIQRMQSSIRTYTVTTEIRESARKAHIDDYESAMRLLCAKRLGINSLLTHRPEHFQGLEFELFSINDVIRHHLDRTTGLNKQNSFQFRGTQSPSYLCPPIAVGKFGHLFICKTHTTIEEVDVEVRIQGSSRQVLLPTDLKMKILDKDYKLVIQGKPELSRSGIGLKFSGSSGEPFIVQIIGKEVELIKTFTI